MKEYPFVYSLRVRWAEVDRQDIVFHAHYLTYCDCANTEYLYRGLGVQNLFLKPGEIFNLVVVQASLTFKNSARFDDLLTVGCRVNRIGRTSLTFHYGIMRHEADGTVTDLALAEVTYVNYDVQKSAAVPLPEAVRQKVIAFEHRPGE